MTHKPIPDSLIRERCLTLLRQRRQGFGAQWRTVKRQLPRGVNETAVLLELAACLCIEKARPVYADALRSMPLNELEDTDAGRAVRRATRLLDSLIRRGLDADARKPATLQDVKLLREALRMMQENGTPDDCSIAAHVARMEGILKTIRQFESEIARAKRRMPA